MSEAERKLLAELIENFTALSLELKHEVLGYTKAKAE